MRMRRKIKHIPVLFVLALFVVPASIAPVVAQTPGIVDAQVASSADDAYHTPTGWPGYDDAGASVIAGARGSNGPQWDGFRWTGLGIPAGATITSAYALIDQLDWGDDMLTTLAFEDAATPIAFSSGSSPYHRWATRTAFEVDWSWTKGSPGDWIQTPSLVAGVQELVDKHGGLNELALLEDATDVVANSYHEWTAYDLDPTRAAKIHIEFSVDSATAPPVRSNGQPSGTLPQGTTQATLALDTNETAECRYSTLSGIGFAAMTNVFASTNATAHSTNVSGLLDGNTYDYFVRCQDTDANPNTNDYPISFTIDNVVDVTPPVISNIVAAPGKSSVLITWTTNEPATSLVAYGLTASLGTVTPLDAALVTSHTALITGLAANTTYLFQVTNEDAAANSITDPSPPAAFATSDADNVAPSASPPGGLSPDQVPQFVTFGSDDNYRFEGNNWLADTLYAGRTNPAGTGNPATFDGAPARGSFYFIGFQVRDYGIEFRDSVKHLYDMGHEIGNHSWDDLGDRSAQQWLTEIGDTNDQLVSVGIPADEIYGFRAPRDAYNTELWPVLEQLGFTYTDSVVQGYQPTRDGTNDNWPYTLDNGSPDADWNYDNGFGNTPPGNLAGFWETPENLFRVPAALQAQYGDATGPCDWNWIFDELAPQEDWAEFFKETLDRRLTGNRAPLHVCIHGQNYGTEHWFSQEQIDAIDRNRLALQEMLDYALAQPDVRVVSPVDVISWTREPVALGAAPAPTPPPSGNWPSKVDLAVGESLTYTLLDSSTRTIKLLSYNIVIPRHKVEATIQVSDGVVTDTHTLHVTFDGVPVAVNGLKVYAYAWKEANDNGFEGVEGGFPLTNGKDVGFAVNDASVSFFPNIETYTYPVDQAFHEGAFVQVWLDEDGHAHSGYDFGAHDGLTINAMFDGYVYYQYWSGQGGVTLSKTPDPFATERFRWTHIKANSAKFPDGTFVTKGTPLADPFIESGKPSHYHMSANGYSDFGSWLFAQEIWNFEHQNDFPAPRYWLVAGPYETTMGANHITANESGNLPADLTPAEGDAADGLQWKFADNLVTSVVRMWELVNEAPFAGYGNRASFNQFGGPERVAYATTYVYSPTAVNAALNWGVTHQGKVWLNGQTIFDGVEARYGTYDYLSESPILIDNYALALPLQAGWNTLIIKTNQGTRFGTTWAFSPKIGAADGSRIASLVFSTRNINLAATQTADDSVALSWTKPDFHGTHIDTYLLDVATDAAFANLVVADQDLGNVAAHTVTGLTPGGTYHIRVKPFNQSDLGGSVYWQHMDAASVTLTSSSPIAPIITSTPPTAVVGQLYSYQAAATGTAPIAWSLISSPLGMNIDATGLVTWTPAAAGSETVTVEASNTQGNDTQTYVIDVIESPTITSTPGTSGLVGQLYSYQAAATGTAPIAWSLVSSPVGMSVDATGLVTWTPSAAGTVSVAVSATNAGGNSVQAYSITVDDTPTPPTITSAPATTAVVGQLYSYQAAATGSAPIAWSLTSNPGGMTIDGTGLVTWAPIVAGSETVNVEASNAQGADSQTFTIDVVEGPTITSAPATSAVVGQLYSYQAAATGTTPISWSLGSGPAGMTVGATGLVTWTPSVSATENVTISATNGGGTDTQAYSIVVDAPPTITSVPVTAAAVGQLYSYQAAATGTSPIGWSLTSGPAGMGIDATGRVTWTPSSEGTFGVTIQAANALGTDSQTYALTVSAPAPQTLVFSVADGWVSDAGTTLVASNTLGLVQASDDQRLTVVGGGWIAFEFGANLPSGAVIQSVTVYVEHHEHQRTPNGSILWQVGTGPTTSPAVLGTGIPGILKGKIREATVAWDVTSWIGSAATLNDLTFVVDNNSSRYSRIDRIYVEVVAIVP